MDDSQEAAVEAEQPAVEAGLQMVPFNADDDVGSDDGWQGDPPNGPDVDDDDGLNPDREEPVSNEYLKKMHVHQIWDFLENITTSVSAQSLASIREKEKHGGAKGGTVAHWARKKLNMYFDKCASLFKDRRRIRLVTDGSTFSCQETQVSIFATESGTACYGTIQRLSTLKYVNPFEIDLEPDAEYFCARREEQRLSSYKYLAALSHQLELLTCKSQSPLTMESFRPPMEVGLLPLEPGDQRFVLRGQPVALVSIQRKGQNRKVVSKLDFEEELPILCLLSDQGPSCTAAAAWLKHDDYSCLVHFQWDGIHRITNDVKGSESKQMSNMKVKTMYCWGVNYWPYGSGGFFAEKAEILKAFMQAETWELRVALVCYDT